MSYKGMSSTDKQRVVSALKSRGAGSCPRCEDSQWTVSEFSRIEVQETSARNGHSNTTMESPVYLDLVTRGLLWACDKLNEDGTPKAGYGPGGK